MSKIIKLTNSSKIFFSKTYLKSNFMIFKNETTNIKTNHKNLINLSPPNDKLSSDSKVNLQHRCGIYLD